MQINDLSVYTQQQKKSILAHYFQSIKHRHSRAKFNFQNFLLQFVASMKNNEKSQHRPLVALILSYHCALNENEKKIKS